MQDDHYPALTHFLEHEPRLRALKYLPQVLEWMRLLLGRYNRHWDKEQARALSVMDVLNEVPEAERATWESAFGGFAAAWNANWPFVDMFECLTLPEEYKNLPMTHDTKIGFCLPCREDEGICPLALVQHLAQVPPPTLSFLALCRPHGRFRT